MAEWNPYFNDRLRKNCDGFSVIVPIETALTIPLKCPVCLMLLSVSEDSEYFRALSCCYKCGLKWADSNKEKWETGWRPSLDEISEEVKFRQTIPVSVNLDALGR